ncbi:MAG TPA: carboxypeptidase-like regulatory domain-containing protein, partial [Chthoniobacterales bacterium]|nr:carboxypeptidase-like regulatory domain-containing protein [Chthoniobacterales bacterium]
MKRKVSARSAFFNPRLIAGFVLCFVGIALGLGAVSVTSGTADAQATASDETTRSTVAQSDNGAAQRTKPQERTAVRSGRAFQGDLRTLPYIPVAKKERPEREPPAFVPRVYQPPTGTSALAPNTGKSVLATAAVNAPAPTPSTTFDGLDYATWGAGHPPDTNGDVGPTYYIQTVNTSIGIYNKSTGVRVAAFTFDTLMSQGQFGNLCDTDNFGDPVVLYDSFENRWVITDFAFKIDNSGNVINPPGAFQCFAVSKTGDPVSGGWNFYSINTSGGLGDYPKFGVWPDGIYMSANMFDYATTGSFQNVRVYAFNKAQMYAGAPTVQVVSFNVDPADFTLLPSNARLQSGTPPAGRPNLFISTWEYLNALTVYKFYVDWNHISLSTFTGPDVPATGSSWPNQSVPNAATPANTLDTLGIRAMAQNQYTNIAGTESLWTTHTVRRATNGFATPRWYQVNVTGGTVAANTLQTASWDPNGADVTYRYIPSLAVDRAGDMALGYTTSNSTTNPGLKYAGRLSTDAANTFSQTEQTLWQGTASQSGTCGASTCTRWGDYSAMTLDPDGCRFWYTNEYYAVNGLNDLTRIGAFKYSQCTPVGSGGTVSGQVTIFGSGTPISGATVALGSRTTTTNGSGNYSFSNIPAGTYPSITASAPGYNSATQSPVVVADNATATKNFALATAPVSACLTDTTQSDFQSGVPTNTDLNSSPGNVQLANSGSGFASSGNFISSLKDANPSSGSTAQWTTLSWTGSAPASTTLRFQAAASNDANGVFDFVGPDGTPNTFFSSGGSLARFNGFRYLKYKALLSTTNSSVTPVVNDVTVCFNNSPGGPTPTPTPTPTATPTPTPTITPTPTPIPKQDQTITFPPISTKTYGDANFDPGATASSGLAVTYTASGQCTIVSNKIHITAAGSCIVTANQSGNGQYNPARPVSQSFSILKAGTTTTSSLLANSPNPAPQFSDTAKLTATVKANTTVTGNGVFSGTVSFTFNGVAVGSA